MNKRSLKNGGAIIAIIAFIIIACTSSPTERPSPISSKEITEYKMAAQTELPDGIGKDLIINNCVHCHSSKLVTQNKATREGWLGMIRWMQKTQGLWLLGTNEDAILDYLSDNFSPENTGRRMPLTDIEWYKLEE